jgi:hypothetical protein
MSSVLSIIKNIFKISYLFSLLFALGSCGLVPLSYPTNETISAAKFAKPTNERALNQIMSRIYESYKDPDSVMIRNLQVGDFGAIDFSSGSPIFGYNVSFYMNAKNGRGAYSGYHYYSYLVTKYQAIEITGVRLHTATYEMVPHVVWGFHSESELRRNAPPSQKPTGS